MIQFIQLDPIDYVKYIYILVMLNGCQWSTDDAFENNLRTSKQQLMLVNFYTID